MSIANEKIPDQGTRPPISNARRLTLLFLFCLAMFLDSFNLTALFTAIPVLKERFNLDESQSSWIISGFQLTYAAFLLIVSFRRRTC